MTYQEIFNEYYALYRAEAESPGPEDEEFRVGITLANEAIARWENYDNTMWNELFTGIIQENQSIILTEATTYPLPNNYRHSGGSVQVVDENGGVIKQYQMKEPQEKQFIGGMGTYSYITGNPRVGYQIRLSNVPEEAIRGKRLDMIYYSKPITISNGSSRPEMKNPRFIVHRMLAQRFRASRNWTGFETANRDAEDALRQMQLENNAGTWNNAWQQKDHSGTSWGL